jgi:uncharacterized protein (DUF433 family)
LIATAAVKTLTPTETAVVASVPVRDVNRIIDEKLLPETYCAPDDRTRRFYADSCALIEFYFKAADRLTVEERSRTVATALARLRGSRWSKVWTTDTHWSKIDWKKEWTIHEDFLTIDLAPFLQGAWERLGRLVAAQMRVARDPEIMNGTPVISGTRIPVYDVAASVTSGLPMERIQRAYPGLSLSPEDIGLAALYAEANPPRGRPRRGAELPAGTVIVRSQRVQRRPRP